ncbi:MAG: hypothetical protein K0U41_08945 [Gammaproteobacteria bacterium]|nr:hypothetical protein [Gammaproteobacteria bacterium]
MPIKETDYEFPFWAKAFGVKDADIINSKLYNLIEMRGRLMTNNHTKRELCSLINDLYAHIDGSSAICERRRSDQAAKHFMEMRKEIDKNDKLQKKYDESFAKFDHLLNK